LRKNSFAQTVGISRALKTSCLHLQSPAVLRVLRQSCKRYSERRKTSSLLYLYYPINLAHCQVSKCNKYSGISSFLLAKWGRRLIVTKKRRAEAPLFSFRSFRSLQEWQCREQDCTPLSRDPACRSRQAP